MKKVDVEVEVEVDVVVVVVELQVWKGAEADECMIQVLSLLQQKDVGKAATSNLLVHPLGC